MEYRKLTELKKLPNNPRVIKDKQFQTLCDSIKNNIDYFEARPLILSNRTGELIIIAGNQRFAAAKELAFKEVPTYLLENLSEEREKEIIIRDNISNGDWDMDLLGNNFDLNDLNEWGLEIPGIDVDELPELPEQDLSDSLESRYVLEIECDSQAEQDILYNRFMEEKLKVKII